MAIFIKRYWPYTLLVFIILLGAFFRLNDLTNIPPGIYPDEAKYANDAIKTMQTGQYKLFYPENNGREGLYIWLLALSFKFFGISILSLKLVTAIGGILTILGTYLLTKEFLRFINQYTVFDSLKIANIETEAIALISAGFLATSFWHINFSRIAFRASLVPLILSFALYFMFKAFRTKRALPYILTGIFWGMGFYTYIAFRLAYLVLLVFFILVFTFYLIARRPGFNIKNIFFRDKWWIVVLMGVIMFTIMLPLILYFYNNPGSFVSRTTGISVLESEKPLFEFAKSFFIHLRMLFFGGDLNWRHNFSGEAQLFWPVSILFILGFWYSLKETKRDWRRKNWTGVIAYLTLFSSLVAMTLPAALTQEGIPHALRAIGMMPAVFIYAALGFLFVIRKIFRHRYNRLEILPFALDLGMVIILLLASFQFTHYFIDWGKNTEVEGAFAKNYTSIGKYFNSLPDSNYKFLIINEGGAEVSYPAHILSEDNKKGTLPMSAQTTLFIQQTADPQLKKTTYLTQDELPAILRANSILVPLKADDEIKNILRLRYPAGTELEFDNFWAYAL
ncbi:MAG: hypothetical protein A3A00_02855 [Candidatus Spechtbacteria bacterium RIFCSPLOWO2_01_FULL_38_20]|nr:MAG: hypothetical protein A3A00_02855 [Candidatus Spechtbacteria bacterium RIFCSPLOWO2_01_FULL_38_20]